MTTKQVLNFVTTWQILIGVAGGFFMGMTCISAAEDQVGLTVLLMIVTIVVLHFSGIGTGVNLLRSVQKDEAEQGE